MKAEQILTRQSFSPELAQQAAAAAAEECSPVSDLRGSEKFKRGIVRVLVRRAAGKAYERALTLPSPSGRGLGRREEETKIG